MGISNGWPRRPERVNLESDEIAHDFSAATGEEPA